jgi:hypothetical protein
MYITKYAVTFTKDGSIHSQTDDLAAATSTAISLSNWNHDCDVLELETGEVVQHFAAYRDPQLTPLPQ